MNTNWRTWRSQKKKRKSNKNKKRFDPGREEIEYAVALFLLQGGEIIKIKEPETSVCKQKQIDAQLYQEDVAHAHSFLMNNYDITKIG